MNISKGFLLALITSLLVLSGLLIQPFLQYVLGAVLLAFVLYPVQIRLEAYVSPMVAAISLVVLAVAGFLTPFVVVLMTVADNVERIREDLDADALEIELIESRLENVTGQEIDIASELVGLGQRIGTTVIERSTETVGAITFHLIGIALAVFLVYYLLKDGTELLEWFHRTVPLPMDIQRDLRSEIDDVMWGVLFGHVFVAVVQGTVAGIGLAATGVPNAAFWTAVMIVFAMVPLVGAIPIWGGAVVYLFLTNEPLLAVGLFVYSVIVVGVTDDYLRPFAVERYANLNPAVILLGILGGAYAFGVMGLFFGPVVLGALKATLRVGLDNWTRLEETDVAN
ncbi:AI-2E family transporter [Halostagnicola kamekurae]|uniref:Predicted PurR-regulated permease PerM n=1 Tax=Halostagnicola kamekurae TaxID=619731 RepID=A0A1I6U9M2_9EURY|nr:AI-2E family transporter [Halostagnicola kamekurae]SFS98143.1 Predicted PurR-regulated permease PerM [Halostagnicola kamekurae]